MKTITINSRVGEDGKLKANLSLIRRALEEFAGKGIELTIKRKYKQRSNPQNAFYWGVTIPHFQNCILQTWGELRSSEEIHEILKATCNFKEVVNENTGEVLKIPVSTTELTTSGWMDYELKMKQFSLEFFGCDTPEPNSQMKLGI